MTLRGKEIGKLAAATLCFPHAPIKKDAMHTTRFAFAFKTLRLFLILLLVFWPFLFASQLLAASLLLFQSRKRLVGLGILTGLALFVLALLLRLELLSLLALIWR